EGLLDSLVLSTRAPVVVCPAMDAEMWTHAATKANLARIKEYGYRVLGPARGELASGKSGLGRLVEPDEIARSVLS
ncbi:MAG: phosphopantothenoylcysteine decarboxylase, partial [Elusimicrobia bacterium]|nr:phosphopantothenoylcysteine decarboxylase [Elusimicrobiota bacterium]